MLLAFYGQTGYWELRVGVLMLSSALLEAFALLQVIHGSNELIWRVAAMMVPVLVMVMLLRLRRELQHAQEEQEAPAVSQGPTDLERKLELLKDCPSVANKVGAADELMRWGRFEEAVPLYQSALTGIYANEPDFLFKLTQAQIEAGAVREAHENVERLMRDHGRYRPEETRLLRARVLEGLGSIADALKEYDCLTSAYVGLEAKCRYGLLLMREGQIEQANTVFQHMVQEGQRSTYAQRVEHHWLRVAAHCQARLQAKRATLSGAR